VNEAEDIVALLLQGAGPAVPMDVEEHGAVQEQAAAETSTGRGARGAKPAKKKSRK
jgi:hypothetical protein